MYKVEESIEYKHFDVCYQKGSMQPKAEEILLLNGDKQKRRAYINSQAKKLKKLSKYVIDLGVFRKMAPPLASLRQHCIPQQIIQKMKENDVIKASQARYQRMLRTETIKKNWSIQDLSILVWLVVKFCQTNSIILQEVQFHKECWEMIESMVVGTTADECLFKWMSFKKISVTLYAWSKQEEDLLRELQSLYKNSQNRWKIISKELFKRNTDQNKIYRQPKQCREHFNSFLDPSIKKGAWSKQEDYMLISAYLKFNCQRRWCQITRYFKNRTENSLKNRFQLLYSKLKIIITSQKYNELQLLKKYTKQLRGEITKYCLEDQMVIDADRMRRQALQGNFMILQTKKKQLQVFNNQKQDIILTKKEQIQLKDQYLSYKCLNKQEQKQQPLSITDKCKEQNQISYKSQTSIGSNSVQINNLNIIVPSFQYKQNINRQNIILSENFLKPQNHFQIQRGLNSFQYFFERFYCKPPYFRNDQVIKEQNEMDLK